jgi:hypothetical protein
LKQYFLSLNPARPKYGSDETSISGVVLHHLYEEGKYLMVGCDGLV